MGVVTLHDWQSIRVRCLGRGEPIKSVSRDTKFSKNTIKKYLRSDDPPGASKVPKRASILKPYTVQIVELLRDDPKLTAMRIVGVSRMRNDSPILISDRAARLFIARLRMQQVPVEAFVRQVYTAGDQMQIDFKDVYVSVDSLPVKRHLFTARLSYSGGLFAKVYHSEDRPSLLDGIVSACVSFGGSARECVFDNATTAVTGVHRGRKREVANTYAEVCGAFAMAMHFAAPARGNEKGGVEGAHGYVEDNFFRPLRDGSDLAVLNAALAVFSERRNRQLQQRFDDERATLRSLPAHLPDTCSRDVVHINKFAEVTFKTNRYSVPSRFAHRSGIIECFAATIRITVESEVIAVHARSFARYDAILEPLHLLELLRYKHRAVERAEVFNTGHCPMELRNLLRAYVDFDRDTAGKRFLKVVELLGRFPTESVLRAVSTANARNTNDPAAIALLLQQGTNAYRVPERLSFPITTVGGLVLTPDLTCYSTTTLNTAVS